MRLIRLTEGDLNRIVSKTVKRILRESQNDDIENGINPLSDLTDEDLLNIENGFAEDQEDMKDYANDVINDYWANGGDDF